MTGGRLPLPVGGPEGGNSAYAFPDRGVVVDPGPPGAWETLRGELDGAGLPPTDVRHVLVTHWHVDHAGLAPRLTEHADATLSMTGDDAPLVADYAAARERRLDRDRRRLREWGVPAERVQSVLDGDSRSSLPDTYPVRHVTDGDDVAGLEVLSTPGHTLGHAAFLDGRTAYVGDLLLPTYTPNVGGGDTRMVDPLAGYLDSLARIREHADEARPGHGAELALEERTAEILAHHEDRSRRVAEALCPSPRTPWSVATDLFGEMRGVHVKMGAGEAASHLAHLLDRGAAERAADDPVAYVRADGKPGIDRSS